MPTDQTLATFVKSLMPDSGKRSDPDRPVSIWKEMDRIRGTPENSVVAIFRTRGCSWYNHTSCTMCGYFNDVNPDTTEENLFRQIDLVSGSIEGIEVLKVFTSGSFLDPLEISPRVREYFIDSVKGKIDTLLVESRTEYINEKNLKDLAASGLKVRIAIGLETSNDDLLQKSINKGSTFAKYVKSAQEAKSLGFTIRTYLLMKPPFVTEKNAIDDVIKSVNDATEYTDDISINPMNVQRNTLVDYLWKRGMYRPPRLWSLARVLLETRKQGRTVLSYPTGGNQIRGVHNSQPDRKLLDLIVRSSLNQDFSELEEYYKSADLTSYEAEVELEHSLVSLMDIDTLSSRFRNDTIVV